MVKLFDFQNKALEETKNFNRVAYYHTMGLGKTYTGAEKAVSLLDDKHKIILVICQKSKIDDWENHFIKNYGFDTFNCDCCYNIFNLTKPKEYTNFLSWAENIEEHCTPVVGIINYDLIFRRDELSKLNRLTLLLDESSMIQNEKAKRTKCILRLHADNVVLLSGTPVGGKYEQLWSQCQLLGWNITKSDFWRKYILWREWRAAHNLFPIRIVTGYKEVDDLKANLRAHGANFLQSEEVLTLPDQVFQTIKVQKISEYKKLIKDGIVKVKNHELVADNPLKKLLYLRMLCGAYNTYKLQAFEDWINSNNERLVVFYNFDEELRALESIIGNSRPISEINGHNKNLENYEKYDNSITLCQYQAAALGMNLWKSNYMALFSPPLSAELYMQCLKRIHRIGQTKTCFYYNFTVENSVEEKIFNVLQKREDYTMDLFKNDYL